MFHSVVLMLPETLTIASVISELKKNQVIWFDRIYFFYAKVWDNLTRVRWLTFKMLLLWQRIKALELRAISRKLGCTLDSINLD